jgi:hypothetical protein
MLRSSRTGPTKRGSLSRASAVIVGALVALFGVVAGPLLGVFAASSASAATTGAGYTAITPFRALGTASAGAAVTSATPVNVAIVGNTAAPTAVPAGATAVVVNVTASAPTSAGYLTLYPQGGTAPATSNVNFTAGETVANLVTVPLSTAGGLTVSNFAGTTAVDIDVEGYYSAAGTGLYNPISPVRVAGTGASGTPIAANTAVPVTVTGGTVPTTATAVVVNLTAAGGTAASYLSAYAAGATPATTSSLNFTAGETVANRDIVNVGTGGQIEVYNFAGSVNVDVDVDGYYAGTGSTFVALAAPIRLTDTRSSTNGTSIASGATETFNLAPTSSTIPTTATGVAANFTVVPGAAPGYITVFPTGVTTAPTASDVNWPASSGAVANFTQADTAGTPTGSVQVFNLNSGSPVDLVIDAFGYFTAGSNASSNSVNIGVPSTTANSISVPAATSNTRVVTATVTNGAGGAVVSGDTVAFTITPANCGTITATEVTSTTGVATDSYVPPNFVAGTTPANCTITAKDADFGQTGTAIIALTEPPNTVAVTAGTPKLPANGAATSTLSTAVTAVATGAANNDTVTYTTSGACGTISPTSGSTGAGNSAVTAVYTVGTTPGFCVVTATEANTGATGTATIDQSSSPAPAVGLLPISGTGVTVTTAAVAGTPGAYAASQVEGAAASTYTVTAESASSAIIVGDPVAFTVAAGTASACGTVAPVTTGSGGTATFTYAAPVTTTPGTCLITATEADTGASSVLTVTQSAPAAVTTITPGNSNVPLGTSTTLSVSVSNVTHTNNGDTVTFTPTSASGGCGIVTGGTTLSVPTGATTGTATATYTSGGTPEFCTVTAVAESSTGTTSIDQTA